MTVPPVNSIDQEGRRKYTRYPVEIAAELEIANEIWMCETHDISLGGLSIFVDCDIKENQKVNLTLILTQDGIEDAREQPFEAKAEIVWKKPSDKGAWIAGLRFVNLGDAKSRHLQRFLAARGQLPKPAAPPPPAPLPPAPPPATPRKR